jgi:thiamine-phosphate pyrophosphorylase
MMHSVVCMITASAPAGGDEERALVERVGAAARASVHLIQIRQPQAEGCALHRLVERSVLAAKGTAARILVNDRVDVALVAGAHGVHLRGDSIPAARVRAIAPRGFLIGRSVHSVGEAARVAKGGDLDYLIFGTVYTTRSKPGIVPAGIDALTAACAGVTIPVLAVGGMTPSGLGAVARAGAAGYAAVGLFADCRLDQMASVVREAVSTFDTSRNLP